MTFPEFTSFVAGVVRSSRFHDRRFDDHFIPQIEYTRDVDRIFRFEQFADGVKSAARSLGLDIEQVPPKPARPYDRYWEFYDPDSKATVEAIYQQDIEAFGYEFEG
jgi:hypothetical protein